MDGEIRNAKHAKEGGKHYSIKLKRTSNHEAPSLDEHAEIKQRREDRHWSEKSLEDMSQRDWLTFKTDHKIRCKGEGIPCPLRSWNDLSVPKLIREFIDKRGYKKPTPIQMQSIPIGLQNRDVIGVAPAGSGKTVAALIPLFAWIQGLSKLEMMEDSIKAPYAIILTPTRQVARQVADECLRFGETSGIRTATVIGGMTREEQNLQLGSGCEIIVATPGRLAHTLEKRTLVLSQWTFVVMDETDCMIEFGFESDLCRILDLIPGYKELPKTEDVEEDGKKYHQTVIFTSTMSPTLERFARSFLRDPCMVHIHSV
ncbi:probable ATP-dependent RNA helicase DDX23 [Haliotis rufescens]|uniref:probable ATP-dependent RNA helicase DDX23 n=1 Tax=Haliotis rufescens TaxID=6454 RepID=UPI00201F2931|nr:probable ATP-dependent RNA helicase DDX23 [Haliotis rufescens]